MLALKALNSGNSKLKLQSCQHDGAEMCPRGAGSVESSACIRDQPSTVPTAELEEVCSRGQLVQ